MFIYDIKEQLNNLPEPYKTQLSEIPENILFQAFSKELQGIIDCIDAGIYIVDDTKSIVFINKNAREKLSTDPDFLIGKPLTELIKMGIFPAEEIVTLPVFETKKPNTIIRARKNHAIATAIPQMDGDRVIRVIETDQILNELIDTKAEIDKEIELNEKYKSELEYFRNKEISAADEIIAESIPMRRLLTTAAKVASTDATLLLLGESGVGKEVMAKFIYKNSLRNGKPFIKLNCSALPENLLESELFGYEKGSFTGASSKGKIGFFELADQGTLLLDEIDTLPLHLQPKLLRVLQEGEIIRVGGTKSIKVDVRLIAATNSNLAKAVTEGRFRQDLYYRLNVIPLDIPALRERTADIMPLASHFIDKLNEKYHKYKHLNYTCGPVLSAYSWPGNVRQLENLMERVYLSTDAVFITAAHLEPYLLDEMPMDPSGKSLKDIVGDYEKKYIEKVMGSYSSTQELANALQIDKSTLTRKIARYGIKNIY